MLLLPDKLLYIFDFLGGWASRQSGQRGIMVLAADARAFVQNRYHTGILFGADGPPKALPQLLLHFRHDLGLDVTVQVGVAFPPGLPYRVGHRERQPHDHQ